MLHRWHWAAAVAVASILLTACDLSFAQGEPSAMAELPWFGQGPVVAAGPDMAQAGAAEAQSDWPAGDLIFAADVPPKPAGEPSAPAPSARPADGPRFVPWRQRTGPAYPGEFWTSFGRASKEFPERLWSDTKATATNPLSLAGIGAAGVTGIVLASTNVDDKVADHFSRHGSQLNTFWDSVGDAGGNPGTHFAFAGAMYFWTLANNDARNYDTSLTLLHALALNGLATSALKGIVRTDSPNGDPFGWPSGHASSSFCFATVMYEEYGPMVGLPLMGFAAFVGYERIDARNHDFSDVISGALLGMAIGHAVAQNHKVQVLGMDVIPYADPRSGAMGVALTRNW